MTAFATYRILRRAITAEVRRLCRLVQVSMLPPGRATMEALDPRVLMSAVQGTIFNDLNANGVQDSGEAGVAGITVYEDANNNGHYDSGEAHTTTGVDGTYSLSGLSAGVHTIAVVTPAGNADSTGEQTISFSDGSSIVTDVDFGQVPVLAGPSEFIGTANGPSEIDLSWTNNAPNATGFEIKRSTDDFDFSEIASVDAGTSSYSDTGLTDGTTYYYELTVLGPNGPTTTAPISVHLDLGAPTDLEITDSAANYVDVAWTNNSTHADVSFVVDLKTNGGGYVSVGETADTSYEDTAISDGNVYSLSVHATDGSEQSAGSNTVTLSIPLSAASDLSAEAASSSEVDLSWTNNSYSNPTFKVERKADTDVSYSLIATTSADATTYADTGVSGNKGYNYMVVATLSGVSSDPSSSSSTTTPPAAPHSLSIHPDSDGGISLTWVNSDSGVPIEIDRIYGGTATSLTQLSGGSTSYYDSAGGLSEGTQYNYQLRAIGSAVDSSYVESASAYTAPAVPEDLSATAANSNEVDLLWYEDSSANPGFVVMRKTDGDGAFSIIATIDPATTTYADTDVSADTGYTYEICAVNAGVTSDPCGSAYAVTPSC